MDGEALRRLRGADAHQLNGQRLDAAKWSWDSTSKTLTVNAPAQRTKTPLRISY